MGEAILGSVGCGLEVNSQIRVNAPSVAGDLAYSPSIGAATVSPEGAAHIGENATIYGVVASAEYEVNEQLQPTLVDLGKPPPNPTFTAIIYGDHRQKFGNPRDLSARQADLRDRADPRLPGEAGDRPYRSQPG